MSVHRKDILHNSPAERVRVMIGVKIVSDIEYIKINTLRACRVRGGDATCFHGTEVALML